jgi:hypothetical protein
MVSHMVAAAARVVHHRIAMVAAGLMRTAAGVMRHGLGFATAMTGVRIMMDDVVAVAAVVVRGMGYQLRMMDDGLRTVM